MDTFAATEKPLMPRRIALIVGVSQYDKYRTGLNSLAAPVNDAQAVYEVLHQYGGFDSLYPLPLGTEGVDASGFVPSHELADRLRELLTPVTGDEVELAVIYFSGHGVSDRGQVVYLSASDERLAVALPWLADLAKNSAVKNVCLWLDCCHSGEVLKFADLGDKGFCVVAASAAGGEALALDGRSLLTELLCKALTPGTVNGQEIRVLDFVQAVEAGRKNLPQNVLCRWGDTPFTLTHLTGEIAVDSPYPPDHPPYKGLLTFTQADREFFFGRDGMIQQLLDRLSASRFVPLLGASGSGKSSLVLAGLLPKLPESDWQVLVMHPTANPLQNLRDTLVRGFPDVQVGTLASGADLHRESLRLATAGKRLLLVIDQFEEAFTECRDDAARAAFFACLLEALDGDNPLHLVLTLRADFLGHCTEQAYSGLGQCLQHHALLLVAPAAAELREAIARPLALVGMKREQALEDELVDQTLHAKGSLPLLQYVLEKLWQSARQERSRELTLAMYQQLGGQHGSGLRGVLNEKADAFYQQLEPQRQRLMEWLMVELVQVNEGQEDTRRTVPLQELHNRQPQYTEALNALLAQLVTQERLLTQDHDDHGQATVTVAHEALIRDWQRLRGCLESNREIKSWRLRTEPDVTDWGKTGGSLLRDGRLAEAQQVLEQYPDSLLIGADERGFIAASQAETKRQTNIALVDKMVTKSTLAIHLPSLANGHVARGLLLAIQAFRLNPESLAARVAMLDGLQVVKQLQRVWHGHGGGILSVAFSPDGRHVVSGSRDTTLRLWDVTTGQAVGRLWYGHRHNVYTVAFSPDGRHIVSGSQDNTLRLWDAATGQAIGEPWRGHEKMGIVAVTFSPDGKQVISVDGDGILLLWDAATGQAIRKPWHGHEIGGLAVAFSPDGTQIVGGHQDVCLMDTATGQAIGNPWHGHKKGLNAVAFSPDGKRVISGGGDKILHLWDVASGKVIGAPWQGHESAVTAVAFSPDGKLVVSGSEDHTLRFWNIATGEVLSKRWHEHEKRGWFTAVAFSPDGKSVVSGSKDKTLRLWDVATGQAVGESWYGHEKEVTAVAFSPDGKSVVSGSQDKTLRLWDVATGQAVGGVWRGHKDRINAVAFSPNGWHVISGSRDKTLRLWDATTEQALSKRWHGLVSYLFIVLTTATEQAIGKPWCGHKNSVEAVAFSPDGKHVISGGGFFDETLQLWNVASGQAIGKPWRGHKSEVTAVAFSPDGKFVVSGSSDHTLRLWDVASGQAIGEPWRGHEERVNVVAFSLDGKFVVSGSWDSTLLLWDAASGQAIGEPWRGHKSGVTAAAFSPDGKFVVSGSSDHTLRLWDVDPESWAKKACSIVNRNFSLAEWQRFIGDALPYEKTCPDLPAPGEEGWVEPYAGG